jgi:hypothetical protein
LDLEFANSILLAEGLPSTKTTYEEKKYEHTTLFIKAFVHKVIEVDGKKNIDRLPLFTA